jgi:4'-phosphopantetheinyl transferase
VLVTDLPPRIEVDYGTRPAHDLLRDAAAQFHQVPISHVVLTHECLHCGSDEHGRPMLLATAAIRRPAYVSLARAGDVSVVAVTDAGHVGVDVEAEGAAEFEGFAEVALHPAERAPGTVDPTRSWVRKEAVLKAYGLGLAVDPGDLRVDDHGLVAWDSPYPSPGSVWLRDITAPGLVLAVAVLPDVDLATLSITVRSATD